MATLAATFDGTIALKLRPSAEFSHTLSELVTARRGAYGTPRLISVDRGQLRTLRLPIVLQGNSIDDLLGQVETINQALAKRNELIPAAKGEKEKKIAEAKGYSQEKVLSATGRAQALLAQYAEYEKRPRETRLRLFMETMEEVYMKAGRKIIVDPDVKGVLPLLDLGASSKGGAR